MVKLRVLLDRSSELVILRNGQGVVGRPNDKSSATRPTGRNDCNQTLRPGSLQRMVGHVAIIITLSLDMTNRSREPKCHPKHLELGRPDKQWTTAAAIQNCRDTKSPRLSRASHSAVVSLQVK